MAKFLDFLKPLGWGNPNTPGKNKNFFGKAAKSFVSGTPEIRENVSTLRPEQEALFEQLQKSNLQPGAGGSFGTAADYYRNLLSDNPQDLQAFLGPEMRTYYQDIMPGLAEQYAGMGAGGLMSSGFRNAQIQGATDLGERLGALRAQLRQSGAQGLMSLGQLGLGNFSQNMITQPGSEGFLANAASGIVPILTAMAGGALGGPAGAAAGYGAGNFLTKGMGSNTARNTSPYSQNNWKASPQV